MSWAHSESLEPDLRDVTLRSEFWDGRIAAAREGALPAIYEQMKQTGRWDCFKLAWKPGDPHKPHRFWDSDVAKWLEAACYSLIQRPDTKLSALVEEAVDSIRSAQWEDGYLNVYYSVVEPGKRWTNVAWSHEMYDAGHLLEAALAHYIYSGSTRLLEPIIRYIKHIRSVFGLGEGQKAGYPGHEEIELALLKTYEYFAQLDTKVLDDSTHTMLLELANYFIEERGKVRPNGHYFDIEARARGEAAGDTGPAPRGEPRFAYYQADQVVREMKSVNGHSVRAMYWLTAVAHLSRLKKDESLLRAAERLWASTTERKMYITGGLGAVGEWEGFGPDYFLPNETGYLETCAAIGLVLFARQMLRIDPYNSQYATIMERALYNGVLVGVGLDGRSFFYENPLATLQPYERSKWFGVSCCPPNVARLLTSLEKYIYTFVPETNTIFVHLYIASSVEIVLASGKRVRVTQTGAASPWEESAEFILEGDDREEILLAVRKPINSQNFKVVLDLPHSIEQAADTFTIRMTGGAESRAKEKTVIKLSWVFPPVLIQPHPLNTDNYQHVALMRGPLVYCAESVDNPDIPDLRAVRIRATGTHNETKDDKRFADWGFQGVPVIRAEADEYELDGSGNLRQKVDVTMIPLFFWANRGPSTVRVWLPSTA